MTAFKPVISYMGSLYASRGWDRCRQERSIEEYKEAFSKHYASDEKDGHCFVAGKIIKPSRKLESIEFMSAIVLDSDYGHSLGEIINAVKKLGCHAYIYSTYSHLKDFSTVPVSKFNAEYKGEIPDFEQFLINKGLVNKLPNILKGAQTAGRTVKLVKTISTEHYIIKHQPCPKYRIVLFLKEPFYIGGDKAKSKQWQRIYCEVVKESGLTLDTACKDATRAHLMPSCPARNLKNAEFVEITV